MRSFILIVVSFIISGCEINAPWPKNYRARVITINEQVCMIVPAQEGEFIASLDISGTASGEPLRKYFSESDERVYLHSAKCVPLYGYSFESGRAYGISVLAETNETQMQKIAGRQYTVSFTLYRDEKDTLQATNTY